MKFSFFGLGSKSTVTSQPPAQPPTPSLTIPQPTYDRGHAWGDKLLRKLSPEDAANFLSRPIEIINSEVNVASSSEPKSVFKSGKHNWKKLNGLKDHKKHQCRKPKHQNAAIQNFPQALVSDATPSDEVQQDGDKWVVPGAGSFSTKVVYTFKGDKLPHGLTASNYAETQDGNAPYCFRFDPKNVTVTDGHLNLTVPGHQHLKKGAISCSEITTDENKILHASIRVRAMFSKVPGVCHGTFFYHDDQQECDIEYLTDATSTSNNGPTQPIPLWYSNQSTAAGGSPTHVADTSPLNVDELHEYRIDWTADFTAFYLDGQLQQKLTSNIPNRPGMWVFNNWCNGNPDWAMGPPTQDSVFKIKDIVMYYNVAADWSEYDSSTTQKA